MSRSEKKVARYLEERSIESFLPLISVRSQWKDRQKLVKLPLFKGYVFARFKMDRYGEVLRIPRLATVVRLGGSPAPVPDEEIENVRRFAERLEDADVVPDDAQQLVQGQRVRIVAHPFDGLVEGIVTELGSGQPVSVFVGVRLIGRFVRIKLKPEDLEPTDRPPHAAL